MAEFAPVLDECVNDLLAGRPAEACLARYPEWATEIRPLLTVAEVLRQAEQPVLGPLRRSAIERRLWAAARHRRRVPFWMEERARPVMRLAGAAIVMVLVLGLRGMVFAAEGALPGEVLYPVKRAGEDLYLTLALTPAGRAEKRLELALERMIEVVTVVEHSGRLPERTLADSVQAVRTAADECPRTQGLLVRVQVTVDVQQAQLKQLLPVLGSADRRIARAALRTLADVRQDVSAEIDRLAGSGATALPTVEIGKPVMNGGVDMAMLTPTSTRRPLVTATPQATTAGTPGVIATFTPRPSRTHSTAATPTTVHSTLVVTVTMVTPVSPTSRPPRTVRPSATTIATLCWPTWTPWPTPTPFASRPTWTPWPTKPIKSWPTPYPTRDYNDRYVGEAECFPAALLPAGDSRFGSDVYSYCIR